MVRWIGVAATASVSSASVTSSGPVTTMCPGRVPIAAASFAVASRRALSKSPAGPEL
jgi:hypothetical protein